MKVYILKNRGYYDTDADIIVGVFSSEEMAKEAQRILHADDIEDFELDALSWTSNILERAEFYAKFNLPGPSEKKE